MNSFFRESISIIYDTLYDCFFQYDLKSVYFSNGTCSNQLQRIGGPVSYSVSKLLFYTSLYQIDPKICLFIVGIFIHFLRSFVIYQTYNNSNVWKYITFNPLLLISLLLFPLANVLHLRIAILVFACKFYLPWVVILGFLSMFSDDCILATTLLPFLIAFANESNKRSLKYKFKISIAILLISTLFFPFNLKFSYQSSFLLSKYFRDAIERQFEFPGSLGVENIGIWWYLVSEAFADILLVFLRILRYLQLLYLIPIFVLWHKKMLDTITAFHVMISIIFWHRPNAFILEDIGISISYLLSHEDVVSKMKSMSWISLGILLPLTLFPIMIYLWLGLGTGNANYVFFQGLAFYSFYGLAIIEFISAACMNGREFKLKEE